MKKTTGLLVLLLYAFTFHAQAQLLKARNLFSKADSLRGTLTPLRTCYDIHYYHLDVKVDIEHKSISGSNLFKFTATEDFQKLQFDLFENLSVDRVMYQGKEILFTRDYNAVFVEFPTIIEKGKVDSFQVYYSGPPIAATRAPWDGGFDWKKDSQGKPWVATACQGLGASVWWPNKDHQSDEVDSMLISVSVPNGVMNVSNGRLIKTEKDGSDYTKYHWKVSNPINNYNVALNIGDYYHTEEIYQGEDGPLTFDYFVLNENKDKLRHLKKNATQTLQAFEHWFGPYPFYRDGYKLVETAHLGMEHQSAVAYGNKYQNGYLGRDNSDTGWGLKWDFIVVHESGHEWFGNNITSKDLADMWIHESFTNYSEALFIDYHFGKQASQAYVHGNRKGILNDSPIQGPYGVNKEGSGDMYIKGGVLMNTIRTIIQNDEKWRSILRGLNKTFYHQTVNYADIVNYVNKKSGFDLTKVFQQYVQYKSIPTLEVKLDNNNQLMARWISEVNQFKMPIHMGVKGGTLQRFEISSAFTPVELKLEDLESLEIDTFNYYIGVLKQ
ncbi:M1 family metallopeptidase [Sphingobacterium sp. JB170]|uniref:M1 family metallopeptidase n=1 Tax=Sphingobacterium sp. JB170 TaxID=1434842 RepID=UPI00097F2C37|nr:M1 family metallopeptidase [Sphingobacterium sp. JB170]SJN45537.1 Peptidase M1 family protein [Sphingobacterium sp. JB170]